MFSKVFAAKSVLAIVYVNIYFIGALLLKVSRATGIFLEYIYSFLIH